MNQYTYKNLLIFQTSTRNDKNKSFLIIWHFNSKPFGTNLKKAFKGLYGKNTRLFFKRINNWGDLPHSWMRKLITILLNFTYKFNINTRKVSTIFWRIWQFKPKFKDEKAKITKTILNRSRMEGLALPAINTYDKTTQLKHGTDVGI